MKIVLERLPLYLIFCLCLPIAFAEIYSENGIVYNRIQTEPFPQIISSQGIGRELLYFFAPTGKANEYDIRICHKDFEKNQGLEILKQYHIFSSNIDAILNLADNECQSFIGIIQKGDHTDFNGDTDILSESVDILLSLPETTDCYETCQVEITIENLGDVQLNFANDAIDAEIAEGSIISMSSGLGELLTLYPSLAVSYVLLAQVPHTTSYNVIFYINGVPYETPATFSVHETPRRSFEIYRENGNIYLPIDTEPIPLITSETGIEREFTYEIKKKNATDYDIKICHKDFEANKNHESLDAFPVENLDKASKTNLDLKANPCQTITTAIAKGETLKLGKESTTIIIDNANVTFGIEPEYTDCDGIICTSEIIIENRGETNITFDSNSLQVSIDSTLLLITTDKMGEITGYECDEYGLCIDSGTMQGIIPKQNIADNFPITLTPNQKQIFTILAKFNQDGLHKYNVSFNFNETEYTIDPYFNVTPTAPITRAFYPTPSTLYTPSSIVAFVGAALSNASITDFKFEVEKPDTTKTNFTANIDGRLYRIGNDWQSDDGAEVSLYIGGDSSFGGNTYFDTEFLIRNISSGWLDGIRFNVSLIFGTPQDLNFIYDIEICPTTTYTFNITNQIVGAYCAEPPTKVIYHANLSHYLGGTTGAKYIQFDKPFYVTNPTNYIILAKYVSGGDFGDNASDTWLLKMDSHPIDIGGDYLYTYNFLFPNGTIWYNVTWQYLGDIELFSNTTYHYNYTDTSQTGTYNVKLIATDSEGKINGTTTTYFIICTANWTCSGYGLCNTSDLRSCAAVIDNNSCGGSYSGDYSEFPPLICDYCMESLTEVYTDCVLSGSDYMRNVSWTDTNYYSCCAITSLYSDCSILYSPYNETTNESCIALANDFDIQYDSNCDLGLSSVDKCYWQVSMNDTATDYRCTSYVLTTDGKLIQSNPPYVKKSSALIQISGSQYEDREYFSALNGLGQVYFTKENLIFDGRQYIFGAQCNSANQSLKSERLVQVGYENLSAPATRFFWGINNITWGIMAVLMFIVAVLIVAWVINKWRDR